MHERHMGTRTVLRVAAGCLALGLVCAVVSAAGPEIAFSRFEHLRSRTFVMDADGSHVTQVHQGEKFRRGSSEPSWSPSGEWIALTTADPERQAYAALFKVRLDGSGLTEMLCGVGTDIDGNPYESVGAPQWSPDGAWILLGGGDNSLVIVGSDETAAADCSSNLVPLYQGSYDPVTETGWSLLGTPAWNADGTAIGEIVTYSENGVLLGAWLYRFDFAVVDGRPIISGENAVELPADLQAVLETGGAWDLDWQRRSGELLTFTSWGVGRVVWLDSSSGAWGYLIDGEGASWSPDNSRVVLDQEHTISVCELAYDASGAPSVVSCQSSEEGYSADWQRGPLPVACEVDGDCDDGNPCTDDSCNGGVCESFANTASCDDANPCTYGDVCGGGACSGTPIDDGFAMGCLGWCCGGECLPGADSCQVDCSAYADKWSCNAEPLCHWDNRNDVCVPR